jgi:LuxR family maltose regulon positive regulatory protein
MVQSFRDADSFAAALQARTQPPYSRAHSLERLSLLEGLVAARERQVVVMQAPAGFGKTTLLGQAMRRWRAAGAACAWLTLDAAEHAPGRLARSLGAALFAAGERDGRAWPRDLLDGDEETAGARLMRALQRRDDGVVLLLDDVHRADGEAFGAELERLLLRLPPHVRCVLSGRLRPRVPLSALRARGLLTEMSAADLRFSRAETDALLGARAHDSDLAHFVERCEGWPAPLQLLLQQIGPRGESSLQRFLATLRDYIEDEVLKPLSPATREALVCAALAPVFDNDLLEALRGQPLDAAARREWSALSPLIAPLARRGLRMHPLLREALVPSVPPDEARRLHGLAAHWFATRDFGAAVHHAGAAGDFIFAAQTILRAGGVRLFIRLGAGELADLIEKLPPSMIGAAAGLRLARAVLVAKKGRLAEARRLVEEARALMRDSGEAAAALDDVNHIDDLIGIYEDRDVDAATLAAGEREIERAPAGDTWIRGWAYNHRAIHLCRVGDLWRAEQAAQSSLACYREERATYTQVFMLIHLALIRSASGRLSMGWEAGREAERLVDAAHTREDDLRAIAQVPLAEIEYARNDIPGARRRLDFAIPVMAAGEGWVDVFARAFEVRIRIALVEEGLAAAFGFLDRGYEIAAARDLWRLRWSLDALRHEAMCRTHLLAEDDEIDRRIAAAVVDGATPQGRRLTWRELSTGRLTLARAALFANKASAALTWLDDAVEQGEALGAYRFVVPALILRAIARERCGDAKGGFDSFLRAVAIAAPQGVLRPFIDEGSALSSLVRQAVRRFGIGSLTPASTEFVATILSAVSQAARSPGKAPQGLLSEREREILGLLNHGLANKEIARSIGVTEPTVKFHLKNLYGKLGVNSRTMALTVARQQRLLNRGAPRLSAPLILDETEGLGEEAVLTE